MWAWSPNGQFTVRNAYWVAKEMSKSKSKSKECGSCSDERGNRSFWSKLRKIPVAHKIIRHFTWRACRDILPSKANLVRGRVLQDDRCEACNVVAEEASHMSVGSRDVGKLVDGVAIQI